MPDSGVLPAGSGSFSDNGYDLIPLVPGYAISGPVLMSPPADFDRLLTLREFPGLPAPESRIFRDWLQRRGAAFDALDFNVRLGEGVRPLAHWPDWLVKMAHETSRLRADVIAWSGADALILEIERRGGPIAIGQLINYRSLLFRAKPATRSVSLLLLAEQVPPDLRPALEDNGIGLELVTPATEASRTG